MDNPQQAINWSYIAGILDGEGTIRLQHQQARNPHLYSPMIVVTSVNRELVEYLQSRMNGWIRTYQPSSPNNNAQEAHTWSIQGRDNVRPILEAVGPFVIVKRPQVNLLLRFLEECASFSGVGPVGIPVEQLEKRKWYFEEFKRINKRGRAAAETEREDVQK